MYINGDHQNYWGHLPLFFDNTVLHLRWTKSRYMPPCWACVIFFFIKSDCLWIGEHVVVWLVIVALRNGSLETLVGLLTCLEHHQDEEDLASFPTKPLGTDYPSRSPKWRWLDLDPYFQPSFSISLISPSEPCVAQPWNNLTVNEGSTAIFRCPVSCNVDAVEWFEFQGEAKQQLKDSRVEIFAFDPLLMY